MHFVRSLAAAGIALLFAANAFAGSASDDCPFGKLAGCKKKEEPTPVATPTVAPKPDPRPVEFVRVTSLINAAVSNPDPEKAHAKVADMGWAIVDQLKNETDPAKVKYLLGVAAELAAAEKTIVDRPHEPAKKLELDGLAWRQLNYIAGPLATDPAAGPDPGFAERSAVQFDGAGVHGPLGAVTRGPDYLSGTFHGPADDGAVVGGVRMSYDAAAVRAALRAGIDTPADLHAIEDGLLASDDRERGVADAVAGARLLALRHRNVEPIAGLVAVSLAHLASEAEPYRDRWDSLPERLRHPGGIRRVQGFELAGDDVVLLGTTEGAQPPIDLDDIVVALRAVWREGQIPFCSLDPDPEGPGRGQKSRIGGVPANSGFAKKMLDADYAMKRLLDGLDPVDSPGFEPLVTTLRRVGTDKFHDSRFWFHPIQPRPGDIQVSPDAKLVLFNSDVQVLSEEIALAEQGMVGLGKTASVSGEAASSFTSARRSIESQRPIFAQLRSLFGLVLLGETLHAVVPSNAVLTKLTDLPWQTVDVPGYYDTITVKVTGDFEIYGGVDTRVDTSPSQWLPIRSDIARALASRKVAAVASPLADVKVWLPAPIQGVSAPGTELAGGKALERLRAGDLDGALAEAEQAVRSSGGRVRDRLLLASVHMFRGELALARRIARDALPLAAGDQFGIEGATRIRVECDQAQGRPQRALADIEEAIVLAPASAELQLMRGKLLYGLDRAPEAREALKKSIALDPGNPATYAVLSMVEGGSGWDSKAKSLAKKAHALGPHRVDAIAALATAELRFQNLSAAKALAKEGLAEGAQDPMWKTLLYMVLVPTTMLDEGPEAAEKIVNDAKLLPSDELALLRASAEVARAAGHADLAARFEARAHEKETAP